jgi:multisubunit Na+/H+ antiporter MnhB subunit
MEETRMEADQRRLAGLRVAAVVTLLLAFFAGVAWGVRLAPDSALGGAFAFVLGVLVLPVAASPYEWLVHRYVYHGQAIPFLRRIYVIHQHGHHYAIFPTWRYVTNGPVLRHPILSDSRSDLHQTQWSNLRIKLAHFAFYMVLGTALILWPAWLATGHVAFVAGLATALVVVSDLFVRVHDAIHYPREFPWLQRQGWFRFLDQHHYIHHVDTSVNVNFLLPLADLLFGTMRRTLTEEELAIHGPLAEAKATPVGASEPARLVARPRARSPAVAAREAEDGLPAVPAA